MIPYPVSDDPCCLSSSSRPLRLVVLVGLIAFVMVTASCSHARVRVPSVVGLQRPAAESTLTADGLKVHVVMQRHGVPGNPHPPGSVLSQSPSAGALVDKGSAVEIVVQGGTAP